MSDKINPIISMNGSSVSLSDILVPGMSLNVIGSTLIQNGYIFCENITIYIKNESELIINQTDLMINCNKIQIKNLGPIVLSDVSINHY